MAFMMSLRQCQLRRATIPVYKSVPKTPDDLYITLATYWNQRTAQKMFCLLWYGSGIVVDENTGQTVSSSRVLGAMRALLKTSVSAALGHGR